MSLTKLKSSAGFTIVELMIALSVLSVLLVITTLVLIQIGALYSKGVNTADLQNVNRTIVADLSGQLQFSGQVPLGCTVNAPPPNPAGTTCYVNKIDNADGNNDTVYSYCVSNTRYSYVLNRELGTDSSLNPAVTTQHVLWRDTLKTNAAACPALNIESSPQPTDGDSNNDGYEMLGNHMRLTRFMVQQTTASSNIYNVDVWMAFGDSDLVLPDAGGPAGRVICAGGPGTQFCSISAITTQITGRIY